MKSYENVLAEITQQLISRLVKEDGEVYIENKKSFAYDVYNIINKSYPEVINKKLSEYD